MISEVETGAVVPCELRRRFFPGPSPRARPTHADAAGMGRGLPERNDVAVQI
jgi:hypothetical protein